MIFTDILKDVDFFVGTDSNTYPVEDKTRNSNRAMDWVTAILLNNDGVWQFDDTNFTNLPIGTTTIVANQQDYSFDPTLLNINAIEIKDPNGNFKRLKPIDLYSERENCSISDFEETSGIPEYYDVVGNSIFLYPKSNYTQANSIKVFYSRLPSYFVTSDTSKEPGFAKDLHRYISISVAYDWAVAKQHQKLNWLFSEKQRYEKEIIKHYSSRNKDDKQRVLVNNYIRK